MSELGGLGGMLPATAWERLLDHGAARRFRRGEVLIRQDAPGGFVLLLRRGQVKVERTELADRTMLLALRGPGEVLGEVTAFDKGPRSATVTALQPCDTTLLTNGTFLRLCDDLDITEVVIRHLLARMRDGEARQAALAHLRAERRVARALLWLLPGTNGVGGPAVLPLTQEEIAAAAGLSRAAVAAELGRLRDQRVVATAPGRVEILEPHRLRSIADGHR